MKAAGLELEYHWKYLKCEMKISRCSILYCSGSEAEDEGLWRHLGSVWPLVVKSRVILQLRAQCWVFRPPAAHSFTNWRESHTTRTTTIGGGAERWRVGLGNRKRGCALVWGGGTPEAVAARSQPLGLTRWAPPNPHGARWLRTLSV